MREAFHRFNFLRNKAEEIQGMWRRRHEGGHLQMSVRLKSADSELSGEAIHQNKHYREMDIGSQDDEAAGKVPPILTGYFSFVNKKPNKDTTKPDNIVLKCLMARCSQKKLIFFQLCWTRDMLTRF